MTMVHLLAPTLEFVINKYFKSFNNADDQHSFLKNALSHIHNLQIFAGASPLHPETACRNCMGEVFASNQCPQANGVALGTFIGPKMKYLMYI